MVPAKEIEKKEEKKVPVQAKPYKKISLLAAEEVEPSKPSKEPSGARPIIPKGDSCCVGLCTYLNKGIDDLNEAIKIRNEDLKIQGMGHARIRTKRQIATLTTKLTTLKDLRFSLVDKNVCTCIELPKNR